MKHDRDMTRREAYWRSATRGEIEAAAVDFFGEAPNRSLSSRNELRFGRRGSKAVDLKGQPGAWFCHETETGGFLPTPDEGGNEWGSAWGDDSRLRPGGFFYMHALDRPRPDDGLAPHSAEERLRRARAIWNLSAEELDGAPAGAYLKARGLCSTQIPKGAVRAGRWAKPDGAVEHQCLFAYRTVSENLRHERGIYRGHQRVELDVSGQAITDDGVKRKKCLGSLDLDDGAGPAFFVLPGDEGKSGPVYVTEGAEDALAVRAAFFQEINIDRPTVVATLGKGRLRTAAQRLGVELGFPLVFVADRDGLEAAEEAARLCGGLVARPWAEDGGCVKDAADALLSGPYGPRVLVERLLAAEAPSAPTIAEADHEPVDTFEGDANTPDRLGAALAVADRLGKLGMAFQFGGRAVLVLREKSGVLWAGEGEGRRPAEFARTVTARPAALAAQCEAVSTWTRWDHRRKREVACACPAWLPQILIERAGADLPPLGGVAAHPIIVDGELVAGRIGYDPRTMLYTDCEPVRPATFRTPREAVEYLVDDWLAGFPFRTRNDALRALLIPLSILLRRAAVRGGAPMPFVTAPEANTGKTQLVNAACAAVLGAEPPVSTFSLNNEELRKQFMAALLESPSVIFYDNLPNGLVVSTDRLNAFSTSDVYEDRLLGASEMARSPALSTVIFTGNNITPGSDVIPRAYEIRLEAAGDRRAQIGRARKRARTERDRILEALLTISRCAWTGRIPGRFPDWGEFVAGPVMAAADCPELLDHWDLPQETAPQNEDLRALLDKMLEVQAKSIRFKSEGAMRAGDLAEACREELAFLLSKAPEEVSVRGLYEALRKFRDQRAGRARLRIEEVHDRAKGRVRRCFRAEEVNE